LHDALVVAFLLFIQVKNRSAYIGSGNNQNRAS
jgi:hypothetical protein